MPSVPTNSKTLLRRDIVVVVAFARVSQSGNETLRECSEGSDVPELFQLSSFGGVTRGSRAYPCPH